MTNYGFKQSYLDGTEHVFGIGAQMNLPETYTYQTSMSPVLNQGSEPICVPCSISAFLNWRENLKTEEKPDHKIDYREIYKCKTTDGEGMTFKEAFHYLRHSGVSSDKGKLMIQEYALVNNPTTLKHALIMNGPCVGALPVFSSRDAFWVMGRHDCLQGYHAISIIGYTPNGFVIRNSWGASYGKGGYITLPYNEYKELVEIWTMFS